MKPSTQQPFQIGMISSWKHIKLSTRRSSHPISSVDSANTVLWNRPVCLSPVSYGNVTGSFLLASLTLAEKENRTGFFFPPKATTTKTLPKKGNKRNLKTQTEQLN